ncbi:Gfo/Idh/MocA family oxidoreductase [Victivallis vadensis]|uniref:Gfo/Idh/MocA family oxidoreductase n=1 Tax=Victivallis vadensis TaxID=172901 RepID=UPI0026DA8EB4|nr:Gfo/Idh/MocA family oxidoreductase [Victivallis vadensis]
MKKIGFIDLYLDEWHANNYPKWFRSSQFGSDFILGGAWEKQPGERPQELWCREMEIPPFQSLDALIETCDAFCVLAPSNPEVHEELAQAVLASGKPVFIDKPFAPDGMTAERLFERADNFNTPLFSSSALRFGDELSAIRGGFEVEYMETQGGGSNFQEYAVHQLEMIVSVMGGGVSRLIRLKHGRADHVVFEFTDGRRAAMTLHPRLAFAATLLGNDAAGQVVKMSNMFPNLIDAMLKFFNDGVPPVDRQETIRIASLLHAAIDAEEFLGEWREI